MAVTENIEVEISIDKKQVDKEFKDLRDDIKGFKKRLASDEATKLALSVSLKEQELRKARLLLRKSIKEGNEEAEIKIRTNITKLSQELTGAKRELRNFARTGEKDVSVLGKLFDSVNNEIAKSRIELRKLWKSTAVLDKLEKEINDVNKEFSQGRIGITEYKSKLNTLQKQLPKTKGAFDGVKKSVKALGIAFVAGLWIATLINFTKDAVKAFADFEKWLSRINTVAGVSEKKLKWLGDEITVISTTFGIAKDELLDTAFNISSAGVEFKNVANILKLSSVVAIGAFTDTTTAFNGIIAVIKKFWIDLNQAWAVAEKFFIANKLGQTTIEDLANAMQNLTSTVWPAGVKIEEVFAILSTLTGVTWNANQVITQLNGAINALAAPTQEASTKFKELGIEVGQDTIAQKGFVTVAKEVFDAIDWNLEVLRKLIPEVEAQKLIVALATTQNDKYRLSLDEVTNSQGNLQKAVNQVTNDTAFQLEVASAKYEDFKVRAGSALISIFSLFVDFASILKSTGRVVAGFVGLGILSIWRFWKSFVDVFRDVRDNFSQFVELFRGFSFTKLLKWELSLPKIDFKNLKQSEADFKLFGGRISKGIEEEFTNITDTLQGQSKQTKLAVDDLLKELEGTDQSFWSAVWLDDKETKVIINNLDTIKGTIIEQNKQLWQLELWSKEFIKLQWEIVKNEEKLNKALWKNVWWTNKRTEAEKELEEQIKKQTKAEAERSKSAQKEIDKAIKESEKNVKSYQDEIEKTGDAFDKLKEKAISDIADIDKELWKLDKDRTQSIAERANEIENEIKEIKNKSELEEGDAQKLIDLQNELKIAKANTTKEAIEEAKRISELSPTALILEEIEAEKLKLEAKKLSIETEIALAEELKNKEIEILEAKVLAEETLIRELWDIRVEVEEFVTKRLWEEAKKQIAITDKVIARVKRLIELKRQAWLSTNAPSTPNISSSTSGASGGNTNSNTVTIWDVIINNDVDANNLINQIKESIIEDSQNADKWIL